MTSQTKVFKDAKSALFDLRDGISLMSGGFGLCGIPENSIREIVRQGIRDIHAISIANNLLAAAIDVSFFAVDFQGEDLYEAAVSGNVTDSHGQTMGYSTRPTNATQRS